MLLSIFSRIIDSRIRYFEYSLFADDKSHNILGADTTLAF